MLKGVSSSNVVDQQSSRRAAVVTTGDASEGFLSRRVPDLQLDQFVVQVHHAGAEFDANGQVMDGLEALVGELKQQTRLSDACDKKKWCEKSTNRNRNSKRNDHSLPSNRQQDDVLAPDTFSVGTHTQTVSFIPEIHSPVSPMMMYLKRYE